MVELVLLSAKEWAKFSQNAHLICFDEMRDPSLDRIDFALLTTKNKTPLNYCTVKELDAESCYWQYGGAFPSSKGSLHSYKSYKRNADYCLQKYKRITTYIQNTNIPMIRIALKVGFKIVGTRVFKGDVFIEFLLGDG